MYVAYYRYYGGLSCYQASKPDDGISQSYFRIPNPPGDWEC